MSPRMEVGVQTRSVAPQANPRSYTREAMARADEAHKVIDSTLPRKTSSEPTKSDRSHVVL